MNSSVESQSNEAIIKTNHKGTKKFLIILSAVILFLFGVTGEYVFVEKGNRNNMKNQPKNSVQNTSILPTPSSPPLFWSDRILFGTQISVNQIFDLHSMNSDGTTVRDHPFICGGDRIIPIGSYARSPDGKLLAFKLPTKEYRQKNPNWQINSVRNTEGLKQETLFIYNLETNVCASTDLSVRKGITFSPDGKYIAYIYNGFHIYDTDTKKDKQLIQLDSNDPSSDKILSSLVWNQKSTVIYMPVIRSVAATNIESGIYPVNLVKMEVATSKQTILMKLPDYYNGKGIQQLNNFSLVDNPNNFAISPDETKIAVEENGDLVLKQIGQSKAEKIIFSKKQAATPSTDGYIRKVVWLPSGWILYFAGRVAASSFTYIGGYGFASYNGENQIQLPLDWGSTDLSGTKVIYNYSHMGDYIPLDKSYVADNPKASESAKYRNDGIGIYDLTAKTNLYISGKDKATGKVLIWIQPINFLTVQNSPYYGDSS